jgi:hypothetical protein
MKYRCIQHTLRSAWMLALKLGQRIEFPNQFHAQMVLDCDSNSKRLDVFKLIPWNRNLHQTSVFLLASESLPLHRRRPYHLHMLKSTGAHAGKLHPSMRRSLPFPHAANSRSTAHAREVCPLHTQVPIPANTELIQSILEVCCFVLWQCHLELGVKFQDWMPKYPNAWYWRDAIPIPQFQAQYQYPNGV